MLVGDPLYLLAFDNKPGQVATVHKHGEGAPQRRPRPRLVELRPEQRSDGVAGVRLAGHGKIGDQGGCFARVGDKRPAVEFHARCTQQSEVSLGKFSTSIRLRRRGLQRRL